MVEELLEKISGLNLVQASELVKKMEEKFGISAVAPVVVAGGGGTAEAEVTEEQSEFEVILESFSGGKKVDTIKKVREVSGLALMDAKKAVESGGVTLKEGASKEDAENIKKDLEALGAKVSLK